MPISTAKIDKQIRKLQQLKRFASDPEMAPLLESLFTSSYTDKQHAAAPNGSRKGDLAKAVGMAVQRLGRRFKVSDVLSMMQQDGFPFTAQKPGIAVNGALRKLVERGVICVAVKGSGRAGNLYERTEESS